jgi:hypothetical protein
MTTKKNSIMITVIQKGTDIKNNYEINCYWA